MTPQGTHFVRTHFGIPLDEPSEWTVSVGAPGGPAESYSIADLADLPQHSVRVTLECAGNGRGLEPVPPPGVAWQGGAVGTAEWTGPLIRDVLALAGIPDSLPEVLFQGADAGSVEAEAAPVRYERSVPMSFVRREPVIAALQMNGEPLAPEHGRPVRVVVPGWYGMASIKWLVGIHALEEPFTGWFQTSDYTEFSSEGAGHAKPITRLRPKSVVLRPRPGAKLVAGEPTVISGRAWTGNGEALTDVRVSTDGGRSWSHATLGPDAGRFAWRSWELDWTPPRPGQVAILTRAADATGDLQPLHHEERFGKYQYTHARPHLIRVDAE